MKLVIYYYSYDTIYLYYYTVYSRDLRYKEIMMESMMKLPDDMFKQELLPYLTVNDIVELDNACMNHKYRPQLMDKINGVILLGDKDKSMKASLFKWLGMRRIYLINILIKKSDYSLTPSSIENDYVDQFRYTQHVVMSGPIRDIFDISRDITDHTLQSIAEHCTELQSLNLYGCREITDTGLITISIHCPELKSLAVVGCDQITDASIISMSTHCTGLQSLILDRCQQISDASIISISENCTGLQSLKLAWIQQITDVSIISISTYCSGLQSLNLHGCDQITDASIISISTHCTGLHLLDLLGCHQITDGSIIPISENCTGLDLLCISETSISDASLIAIAKNCTGLQLLDTYDCDSLSSYKLRYSSFQSVSQLRAVLLSIYPSLLI
jgi:hypothetical protein